MIKSTSIDNNYKSVFTNKKHNGFSDTSTKEGGGDSGFRPHQLLEASMATCITTWVRMYSDKHNIPLEQISAQVSLNRTIADETIFEYEVQLTGPLTLEQHEKLMKIAKTCPVHKTLLKKISFRSLQ